MKRIFLMLIVAVGLLVPGMLIVGQAGAANPHGNPNDPSGSCGPASKQCDNAGLNQSEGCEHAGAAHNPHCTQAGTTTTPSTPTTPTTPTTTPSSQPAGGTAGVKAAGGSQGASQGAAGAAQGGNAAGQLAFTGLDELWLALLGAGLLGSGLVLRTRFGTRSESI